MNQEKKILRRELLAKRRLLTENERSDADRKISRLLLSLPEYKNADVILIYASYGEETDTSYIAKKALADGKRLAFPRCEKDGIMKFFFASPNELTPGFKGIPEPPVNAPLFEDSPRALCIVPALAVDKRGFRIGYGGGFYDRFLSGFCGVSIALIRDLFFFDSLPTDKFDLPVNITVTQSEVIYNEN